MKINFFKKKKKTPKIKDRISSIIKSIDKEVFVNRGSRSLNSYSFFNTVDNNRNVVRRKKRRRK